MNINKGQAILVCNYTACTKTASGWSANQIYFTFEQIIKQVK